MFSIQSYILKECVIKIYITALFFLYFITSTAQNKKFALRIDSLLSSATSDSFNGVILIAENGKIKYSKSIGYSDLDEKSKLKPSNQFIVGSISKQFTAVMVLQELEKGHLDLFTPVHLYLPELKQSWADTVTVHHLLTHMHGIIALDQPTVFKAGARFDYSNSDVGYKLLAMIIEKVSGESFAGISAKLFEKCGMKHTFHPDIKKYGALVKGYTLQTDGKLKFETSSFQNSPAAGGFISTAGDLAIWNEKLHNGKLLKEETYQKMITKQRDAVRMHPLWGTTCYGYGITITENVMGPQLGQTGFAPGFASMDYYFPETKTSVIVLENVVNNQSDLKRVFSYHVEILNIFKDNFLKR